MGDMRSSLLCVRILDGVIFHTKELDICCIKGLVNRTNHT